MKQISRSTADTSRDTSSELAMESHFFDLRRPSAVVRCSSVFSQRASEYQRNTRPIVAEGASVSASTINMINTILGTGLLSLPTVYASAGFVTGTIIVVLFGLLSIFTNGIFVECALLLGRPTSFTIVANKALAGSAIGVDAAIILNSLGTSISYIIVATDGFENVFGGPRYVWTLVLFAIAGTLAFLQNMDSLRITSLLAVVSIAYITIVIVLFAIGKAAGMADSMLDPCPTDGASPSCPWGETSVIEPSIMGNLGASASLGLAFGAIYSTPPIFNEIVTPQRGTMMQVACVAFGFATCLYILVGCCGYYTYGSNVKANILNSYPDNTLVNVARIGLSFVVIFSFPIQILVSRISATSIWATLERSCLGSESKKEKTTSANGQKAAKPVDVEAQASSDEPGMLCRLFTSDVRGLIITSVLIAPALIVALVTNDVGAIFSLTGAIGGSLVIFIFPGALYFRLFPAPECTWVRCLSVGCFFLGWILMVLGIVTTLM